jgi:hypothetical protein
VPVDEPFGDRAQRCVGIVSPVEHVVGDSSDTSRDHPSTVLKATTRRGFLYSPKIMLRTIVPKIGLGKVRLSKRPAILSKILNYDVDRDVVLRVQWGHDTQPSLGLPSLWRLPTRIASR